MPVLRPASAVAGASPVQTATRTVGSASIRSSSRATKASLAPYAAVAKSDPPSMGTTVQAPGTTAQAVASPSPGPASAWFGYSPQIRAPTSSDQIPSRGKGAQKGSRTQSKTRKVLADSAGWERDQVPVRAVIDKDTPRCANPVTPQTGMLITDEDWKDMMSIFGGYFTTWEDKKCSAGQCSISSRPLQKSWTQIGWRSTCITVIPMCWFPTPPQRRVGRRLLA